VTKILAVLAFPVPPGNDSKEAGKSLRRTPEKQEPAQYVSDHCTTPQIFPVVAAPARQ